MIKIIVNDYKQIAFLIAVILLTGCNEEKYSHKFSLLTFNIGNNKPPLADTITVCNKIKKIGKPEILILQDIPWKVKIYDLANILNYQYCISGRFRHHRNNLGILTNYKILHYDAHINFNQDNNFHSFVKALIKIKNKKILITSVHLESLSPKLKKIKQKKYLWPIEILKLGWQELFCETERTKSVTRLLKWVEQEQADGIILAGDFNTFPFAKPIRMINNHFKDSLWLSSDFFTKTYTKIKIPAPARIDYIFYSPNLACLHSKVITETVGDHYPVWALFGI